MSAHPGIGGIRLAFGGNVFGWTIGRDASFAVLDAFYEAGGRMIDTAEGYSAWVPGHKGGESESVLGEWLEARGVRKDVLIGTKTGMGGPPGALAPDKVAAALEGSLERLRTDYVDLYYAHRDEPQTPLDEVAQGFDALVRAGKVRELGASNFTAERLQAALDAAKRVGARPYTVLQNQLNLVSRADYPPAMQALCREHGIAVLPYYALASGFLTGKYRRAEDWAGSTRGPALDGFARRSGFQVLGAMDRIAAETGASHAQIALAWLNAQPGVAAPIASATTPAQLTELIAGASLVLEPEQLAALDRATN